MSTANDKTKVDAFIDFCKNNKWISLIVIMGLLLIAVSQVTDAFDKIRGFFQLNKSDHAEQTALFNEARFRITQVDEALRTAMSQGKACLDRQKASGSVLGADIRDYLTSAQIVSVTLELGGIYRNPGQENDTVWISSNGYGLRHLPEKSGSKDTKFKMLDLCDISRDYLNLQSLKSERSCFAAVSQALNDLKARAHFTETGILDDWFKRSQARDVYKARYADAYKVYEVQVDDYGEELSAIDHWVQGVYEAWSRVKKLKTIAPFSSQ